MIDIGGGGGGRGKRIAYMEDAVKVRSDEFADFLGLKEVVVKGATEVKEKR